MQKKLLTVAVAGALAAPGLALAQSSVELYGVINMSVNSFRYSEPAAGGPSVRKWDVANHASNYGIRGRESLGGGLTAWFQVENNVAMERSNNIAQTVGSRNSAVGLQGGWGNAFIGQWTTPWADLEALWSVGTVGGWSPTTSIIGRRETTGTAPNPNCQNGHLSGAPAVGGAVICDAIEAGGGVGHPFWRRISNAVFYHSPNWNGIQAKLGIQTNEGKAETGTPADPSMWSASLQYGQMSGGRIGIAIDRHEDFTTIGQTDTGWKVAGGWNFGFVDVGAVLERMTYKTATGDTRARQWGLAANFPIGSGAIKSSYAVARDLSGGAGEGDNGAKHFNIGYEHRLSKRTTLGVGYARITNDDGAVFTWTGAPPNAGGASNTPAAGSDPSTVFVSLTHRF